MSSSDVRYWSRKRKKHRPVAGQIVRIYVGNTLTITSGLMNHSRVLLGSNGSTTVGTNKTGTFILETVSLVTAPEPSQPSHDHHVIPVKSNHKNVTPK